MNALLILQATAVVYGVAAFLGLFSWVKPGEGRRGGSSIAVGIFWAGAAVHLVSTALRGSELGSFPMANTHDALSLFALTLTAVALGISVRGDVPQVVPIASALAASVVVMSVWIEPATEIPVRYRSPWLPLHIGLAYLGNAAFVVAGIVAFMYLLQDGRLRAKSRNTIGRWRLPALELLDRLSVRLIEVGFPLMTLAIVSGVLYGREVWGTWWRWEVRNVLSVVVWLLFALLLHFRITIGWRGRKAAFLTVMGVVGTLVSLVGLNLLGFGHSGLGVEL